MRVRIIAAFLPLLFLLPLCSSSWAFSPDLDTDYHDVCDSQSDSQDLDLDLDGAVRKLEVRMIYESSNVGDIALNPEPASKYRGIYKTAFAIPEYAWLC